VWIRAGLYMQSAGSVGQAPLWSEGPGTVVPWSGDVWWPSADRCAPVVVSMLLLRSCLYQISVRSVTAPPFRMLARVLSCLRVRVRVLLAHLLCADGLARSVLAGAAVG